MSRPESRAGLTRRKEARPHPALPSAAPQADAADGRGGRRNGSAHEHDAQLVMFCVRIPRKLRKRIKVAAAHSGKSVQDLGTDALEAECWRHGV